ncbi:MAG: histidinol-phosphate transaminase [Comamonadaceae bacterium]|nr:MAG: histidinol-phosphate transaminase [Comamonadaceae bacterium]
MQPPSLPEHIAALKPYLPGMPISELSRRVGIPAEAIVKLASNENPLGASPKALAALARTPIDLSRYPDNDCAAGCEAIAAFHDVPADWVVLGAGSESLLGILASALLAPGRSSVYSQYSFQAYVNAVQKVGARSVVVASPHLKVDLQALATAATSPTELVYVANPGNPTGTSVDPDELDAFIAGVASHTVVLLDEAYFEFMPAGLRGDSIARVRRHPNLVLTRTFSKAYGLAGLRIGYAIAQSGLADLMRRVRSPFTISEPAQVAAVAALDDAEFIRRTVETTNASREILVAELEALGMPTIESHTNFVLADVKGGAGFAKAMEGHGFIVRPVASYGLPQWVRIGLGTPEEMRRFVDVVRGLWVGEHRSAGG